MLQTVKWKASKREPLTQGEMKQKRKEGFVPAVIVSRGKQSVPVFITGYDLLKRPFGNFRIELNIEGEKKPVDCLLKDLQYNFSSDRVVHADLHELTVGQELDVDVAFELMGEPAALKNGGVLNTAVQSVRIRTLPRNIPEKIEVDISGLKMGGSIHISDIKFAKEHTLLEPTEGVIVYISEPKMMAEPEAEGEMPEPEIISEKTDG